MYVPLPTTFLTLISFIFSKRYSINETFSFCEWHSHEPYSTCHSWPTLKIGPLTQLSYFAITECDTQNVMHKMWHTNCDTQNVKHKMWHTNCDTQIVTHKMWPRWGGDTNDTDRKVTQLRNIKGWKPKKLLNINWKHTAAITFWVTTVLKTHHEPM